jgi:hypothetical protein
MTRFSLTVLLAGTLLLGVGATANASYEVLWAVDFNSSYTSGGWTYAPDVSGNGRDIEFYTYGSNGVQPAPQQFDEDDPFGQPGNLSAVLEPLQLGVDDHRGRALFPETFDLAGDPGDPNYEKFTVEAWARVDADVNSSSNYMVQLNGTSPATTNVTIRQKESLDGTGGGTGAPGYRCYLLGAGTGWGTGTGSFDIGGGWHHIALTYDRDAAEMNLYFDGQLAATETEYWNGVEFVPLDRMVPDAGELSELLIGRHYDGKIDDVRVSRGIVPVQELGYYQAIPEPMTMSLLGLGGLALLRRRG